MKIVVASGKGGVGKSMLTSSLVLLLSKKNQIVACDCDVDAPNLGLWLGITDWDKSEKVSTSFKAKIDQNKCIQCGKCKDICRFYAVEKDNEFRVNQFLCEGCGACELVCPSGAIEINPVKNGELRDKKTDYGFTLVSGQLYPGESGSGKIVEQLKEKAGLYEHDIMILDAAAGIGCPVIASIRGSDYAVLVTEPTPSGFSDLKRILEIVNQFGIPYGVVVNKWNINPDLAEEIEKWSGKRFLGKISYDKKVIESIVNLKPVLKSDSKVVEEIKEIYKKFHKESF
ncbi:MAG: P-loop NTPase [Candidatus Aenigmarchaeota archaeon]|nr:P-loop NTPase [Candidatus Aenigmarchaeota archaeon]